MTSDPSTEERVHEITGWRKIALWPLGLLMTVWGRTLRIECSGESLRLLRETKGAAAIVLWHNRLFSVAEIKRRYRPQREIYGLVSASKDGAWLAAFFETIGIRTVRGSSSRLGREALRTLEKTLRAGADVGITPDGPRGPCYDFKPSALLLVRRTQGTLLLVGVRYENAWRLKTWDKFFLPKPFSKLHVTIEQWPAELVEEKDSAEKLRERLLILNQDMN